MQWCIHCDCNGVTELDHCHPGPCGTRLCNLEATDERYRDLFCRDKAKEAKPACRFRGEATGETVGCQSCSGTVKLKLFTCDKHGDCTDSKAVPGHACCQGCPDDESAVDPFGGKDPIRNLLYHLYPIRGQWQWHAKRLRDATSFFTGRRIVAVATSDSCDPVEAVKDALPGFEIIAVQNNPTLREVATFEPLFSSLQADGSCTLFAQSKSVTHGNNYVFRRWAEMLYETCLDYWPWTKNLLKRFPVAGSFLKVGRGWPAHESESKWHYSGSWFWFRNNDLFGKPDWKRINKFWAGIEPYPSLHFGLHQAGCIFHRGTVPTLNFYEEPTNTNPNGFRLLNEVIEPALREWRKIHAHQRTIV